MRVSKKNIKEAISNVEAMVDATAVTTPVTAKLKKDMKKKYQDFEKITVSKDNFLGAKKQPLPKKVEVPKSQAKLDLDESLFESSNPTEERDFITAYTWAYGETKKKAKEVYKKQKSEGKQSYIDEIIKGFKENAKKSFLSDNLHERNLTRAERHNRDMENIFSRYNKLKDNEAKFLISKGVSEDEVKELRKNTGLGRDALEDKMVELGVRDEFFKQGNIFESKRKSGKSSIVESKKRKFAKKLREGRKSLNEATYSDQLYDELYSIIDNMDSSELTYTWNTYCDEADYADDYLYSMEDIDEILDGQKPWDILRMAFYGNFNPTDKYFRFDGYGNLASYNYLTGVIEIDDMIDHIIERDSDLGSDDIRLTLDQFSEGKVEESLKEGKDSVPIYTNVAKHIKDDKLEPFKTVKTSNGQFIDVYKVNGKFYDANGLPCDDLLEESKQQLNEGPGAGYTIKSKLRINNVESATVESSNLIDSTNGWDDKTYDTYDILLDCSANATVYDLSAYSYYYGADLKDEEFPAKVSRIKLEAFVPGGTDINSIDFKELLSNCEEEIENDIVYGGGWSHSTYDGEVANMDTEVVSSHYEVFGDIELTIYNVDAYITDEEVVQFIDKAVTGDNLAEMFIVCDEDDDEIDSFDDEESAIEFCDKTPGSYVLRRYGYINFYGDIEDDDSEVVYTNGEDFDESLYESVGNYEDITDEFEDTFDVYFMGDSSTADTKGGADKVAYEYTDNEKKDISKFLNSKNIKHTFIGNKVYLVLDGDTNYKKGVVEYPKSLNALPKEAKEKLSSIINNDGDYSLKIENGLYVLDGESTDDDDVGIFVNLDELVKAIDGGSFSESLKEAKEKKEKTPVSKEEFIKKFPKFFYRDNISKEGKLGFEVSDLEDDTEFKKFAKEHGNKVLVKKFDLFDRVLEELAPEHVNIKRVTRIPSVEKDDRYDYEELEVMDNHITLYGKDESDLKLAEDIAKQYKNDGVTYSYDKSGNWRGPNRAVKISLTVPVKENK